MIFCIFYQVNLKKLKSTENAQLWFQWRSWLNERNQPELDNVPGGLNIPTIAVHLYIKESMVKENASQGEIVKNRKFS